MWYEFWQNDVDGKLQENDKLCSHILIEADNNTQANQMAKDLGIIFDDEYGYDYHDCRWSQCYYQLDFPCMWDEVLIKEIEHYAKFIFNRRKGFAKHTKIHSRIFHKDGNVTEIGGN